MKNKKSWPLLQQLAMLGVALMLASLYWHGAVEQLTRMNTNPETADQSAYMAYAHNLAEPNDTFIGDRNRMPIYPLLQSLFYRPGMSDEAFFTVGKYVNLWLSLGLLAGLAALFRTCFPWPQALTLLLIVAFTVFIFKAGYVQAELLFYFLNFLLFWLMWRLLQRHSWSLAIVAGVVAGLAHLTKASILPGLSLFLFVASLKWAWVTYQNRHDRGRGLLSNLMRMHLLPILLVGLCFLLTVSPYITTSKRVFGHYFYNVNSTFYIWYDSWDEAKAGTRAHGDRVGWPDLPPSEIPTMTKYWREHTPQQIVKRVVDGGRVVLDNVIHSYGYFKYLVIYLGLLLLALLSAPSRARQAIGANLFLCLFLLFYFAGYFLLCFWYAPIADGNRIILAQFIPFLFTLAYVTQRLARPWQLEISGHTFSMADLCNGAILLIVSVDMYFVLTQRVGTMYGGW